MQNYAKTSGILSIVSGVFGLLGMVVLILMTFMFRTLIGLEEIYPGTEAQVLGMVSSIYIVSGVVLGILGVFSIVGGVYAIQRRYWGLALAAAIVGTINFFPTGIPAVIFASMGKSEFDAPPDGTGDSPVQS